MKKKIVLLGLSCILLCGCGKEIPKLKDGSEAVVSFENGDKISVDTLYEEIKNTYGLNTLMNLIDKHVLEKEFKSDVEKAKKDAESTIKTMKESYGDQLQTMIQQYTGMPSIEAYQDYLYLNNLKQKAILAYAKTTITEDQINKYYENDVYPDILVSHILITPDVKDDDKDEDKTKKEEAAEAKIKEVIEKLNTAKKEGKDIKETFTSLAKEYSQDDATKKDGGSMDYINYDILDDNYKNLLDAAYKLKDGEYSSEVIKTELGYHVILREKTKEKDKLEDIKDDIIEDLANKAITDDSSLSVTALQHYRNKQGMEINDSELNTQYSNYISNVKLQSQTSK
ncbi:MAG: peptidylprolyl isomerase [Bacilli bacterium]|nr:peptidylprolyl isomerase [Bacilli bacterium]